MFNDSFYPTPSHLVTKMWHALDHKRNIQYVLEPSAGKGDIVTGILNSTAHYKKPTIECVELDTELSNFLTSKGYSVVGDDFLNFTTYTRYDAIIMNPPFANGDKHLLKAIDLIERNGGQIVCLLNAETLKNPFSNARKDLAQKLEKYAAKIEYIQNAFNIAERKTNVEIAFIYINIEKTIEENSIFNDIEFEIAEEFPSEADGGERTQELMTKSQIILSLISDYEKEVRYINRAVESLQAYKLFLKSLGQETKLRITLNADRDYTYSDTSFNEILIDLRKKYWKKAMQINVFERYLTNEIYYKLQEQLEKQSNIEFNYNNLMKILAALMDIFMQNIGACAIKVFDDIKQLSHYDFSENIYLYNGWKTNNGVKVNKKIITRTYDYSYDCKRRIPKVIIELDKVFNYFDNFSEHSDFPDYESVRIVAGDIKETEYFSIKSYKKGTFHVTIKRLDLLDKFNIFVGQQKNWLPHAEEMRTPKDKEAAEKILNEICESELNYMNILLAEPFNLSNTLLLTQGLETINS